MSSLLAYGQVLDNRSGEAFTDKPFFNVSFVKENKIKQIKGEFSYMKTGKGLVPMKYYSSYFFDKQGRLKSSYETRPDDGSKDTSWNHYVYNDQGLLAVHRSTEKDGLLAVHYTYDSIGRVVTEEYKRDIDSNGRIIRSLSFNKENIKYSDYGQQIKRTRYNNYDLPYLDEFFNYNEMGYLVERVERIKMTSTIYTYDYEYNEQGKLAAIRKKSNRSEVPVEEMEYAYDELGNLKEKLIYRNGELKTNIQIIYNSKTHLLESVITTEEATGFMMVCRYRDYKFYN
jgi:YD repeat-containing protein